MLIFERLSWLKPNLNFDKGIVTHMLYGTCTVTSSELSRPLLVTASGTLIALIVRLGGFHPIVS